MKAEAAEEARRWEEEQEAERKRKDSMMLSQEEKDKILQVSNFKQTHCKFNILILRVFAPTGPL